MVINYFIGGILSGHIHIDRKIMRLDVKPYIGK